MQPAPVPEIYEVPIRKVVVSGYRGVPPSEVMTIDMGRLTLFIGDIESGKSVIINILKLLSLYLLSNGKKAPFNPKKDLHGGMSIPAYIVFRFNPLLFSSLFTLQNVTKYFSVQDAVNIIQRIEQLRPRVAASFDAVSLELTPEGKVELVPFIDAIEVGARMRGGLRRVVSERIPELLNIAPMVRSVMSGIAEKIDYMPTLFKQLSHNYSGIPFRDPFNPTAYYFYTLMIEYPSDEELRQRLRDYLSKVLPYSSVRVGIERTKDSYMLEIELYDKLRGEWRPLDTAGLAASFTLPHIVSLARAKPGDVVLLDSVGLALSPSSARRMGRILVEAAERGVQVVASTSSEDVAYGVLENARRLPLGQLIVYVVKRVAGGAVRAYRIRPELPIREPIEAVEALEEAGMTRLLKAT